MNTIAISDDILDTETIGAVCGELRVMEQRLIDQTNTALTQHGNKDQVTWDWTVARTIDLAKFYRTATLGIVNQWAGQVPAEYQNYFWSLVTKTDRAAIQAFKAVHA